LQSDIQALRTISKQVSGLTKHSVVHYRQTVKRINLNVGCDQLTLYFAFIAFQLGTAAKAVNG